MSNQIRRWKSEHADFVRLLGILNSQIGLFHEKAEANYVRSSSASSNCTGRSCLRPKQMTRMPEVR